MSEPRDLAAEVEAIKLNPPTRFNPVCEWSVRSAATPGVESADDGYLVFRSAYASHAAIFLEYIAELDREIEELRRPLAELKKEAESEEGMEPQRMMQYLCRRVDALQKVTRRLQPDNERLRAENERLKRSFGERYDDKRDMPSIIEHLRYGDSDGDDHDAAAAEIERLQSQLTALRRPVVESEEVGRIRTRQKERDSDRDSYGTYSQEQKLQAVYDCGNMLLQYDAVQHQIRELIANHEKREDQMEEEIARLSSPPEERPIVEWHSWTDDDMEPSRTGIWGRRSQVEAALAAKDAEIARLLSALRARQRELVIEVSMLKDQLHTATCELLQVDAQLGERRDLHPTTTHGNY